MTQVKCRQPKEPSSTVLLQIRIAPRLEREGVATGKQHTHLGDKMRLQINHNAVELIPNGIKAVRIVDVPKEDPAGDNDWHTQVTIRGPEGSTDFQGPFRHVLKEGHTYDLEFDIEVVDSYAVAGPSDAEKWWNSQSFTVVQQIWSQGGPPPFAIYLDHGKWQTKLNRIGTEAFNRDLPFDGPGTYHWKVTFRPDSDGTHGGLCTASVRGPNTSVSVQLTHKTGKNMNTPSSDNGPIMQFGAYTRLATHKFFHERVELRYDKVRVKKLD